MTTESLGPSNDKIPAIEWRIAAEMRSTALDNAAFADLPSADQRVTIARDVLLWLKVGKLKPTLQTYGKFPAEVVDVVNGYDCHACALGGVFACAVERGQAGGTVVGGGWVDDDGEQGSFSGEYIRGKLAGIFDPIQLGLIEAAFEGLEGTPREVRALYGLDIGDAYRFALKHGDRVKRGDLEYDEWTTEVARARMVAIMRNVIRNRGTFIP